jgi:hypothetical protein
MCIDDVYSLFRSSSDAQSLVSNADSNVRSQRSLISYSINYYTCELLQVR